MGNYQIPNTFRQMLLPWQSLDELARLYELTQAKDTRLGERLPMTIDEVLQGEF